MAQRGSQDLFRADRGCASFAGCGRRYANVRRTLAQFPTQSCRRRLLLLSTDLVGEEKHRAVSGPAVACYLHASSSSSAMVDSGDADRGVFGYGLGACIGGPRTPLRQFEGRQAWNRMAELCLNCLLRYFFRLTADLFRWLRLSVRWDRCS